eukprot:12605884-Ditylum_brightwellii.AAC.1
MERSMQNKHVVGNKDNGVDNSIDDCDGGANKYHIHPSQVVDCHSMERIKQNKHVVGNKDN